MIWLSRIGSAQFTMPLRRQQAQPLPSRRQTAILAAMTLREAGYLRRSLLIAAGLLSTVLAVLGIFLPLLPTVPCCCSPPPALPAVPRAATTGCASTGISARCWPPIRMAPASATGQGHRPAADLDQHPAVGAVPNQSGLVAPAPAADRPGHHPLPVQTAHRRTAANKTNAAANRPPHRSSSVAWPSAKTIGTRSRFKV